MVRIIPWNLPPVNGGSVGGYTPDPTPTPSISGAYDFDDMVLSTSFVTAGTTSGGGYIYTHMKGKLTISGITVNDASNVTSVIATVHATPGTDTWNNASTNWTLDEADIDVDISSLMSSVGGDAEISNGTNSGFSIIQYMRARGTTTPVFVSSTSTLDVTSIRVYNSNGVVIQEWTP